MPLITLVSAPKPFTDPATARSQRNAIRSWKALPDVELLLLGEEAGLAEAAAEMGARHVPNVAFNPNHVPLVSSMLELARQAGESSFLCIINADIILLTDFVEAARQLASSQAAPQLAHGFVLVSRRWDLDVEREIEFKPGWDDALRDELATRGGLHRPTGSDFFLFPRGCYPQVPDFAIGRAGWDNWMIYHARRQGWAVVDGTASLTIIHQNHDYRHLPGAKPHYNHPDTAVNTRLAGGDAATRYTILDANYRLVNGELRRPAWSYARTIRGLELILRRVFFFLPENVLERVARPQRWSKRLRKLFRKAGP